MMKSICPLVLKKQCSIWQTAGITLLVFLAVFAIVSHTFSFSNSLTIIVTIAGSLSTLWCLWVIFALSNLFSWWAEIRQKVDSASCVLQEARDDIREIKTLAKP